VWEWLEATLMSHKSCEAEIPAKIQQMNLFNGDDITRASAQVRTLVHLLHDVKERMQFAVDTTWTINSSPHDRSSIYRSGGNESLERSDSEGNVETLNRQ